MNQVEAFHRPLHSIDSNPYFSKVHIPRIESFGAQPAITPAHVKAFKILLDHFSETEVTEEVAWACNQVFDLVTNL